MKAVNLAVLVSYDGTDFFGFQYQPNVPTIQGALEDALLGLTQQHIRIDGSGRTDSGVHARGQVVAAKIPWRHSLEKLVYAWNTYLPPSIRVRAIRQVPDKFHPRFSARLRTYRYTIVQPSAREQEQLPTLDRAPLTDRFALFEPKSLAIEQIQKAANFLIGEHDFATFGRSPQGDNTVRTITQLDCQQLKTDLPPLDLGEGATIIFTVTANAFLRKMVRNIVGTLLDVGRGHRTAKDVKYALQSCDRNNCSPPSPSKGLVLEHVSYPDYPDLF